jgi:serine/threonine protein kinase
MERAPTGEFPIDQIIPENFGDYQRLDEGHSGGMGTVYKVFNRRLNVERALKVLKQELTMHPAAREAFVREAHFGAQLAGGPYILPVHTVGTLQRWYYFEMDWVEGPNLHHFVQQKGNLDPWAALAIAWMICDALHYAHHAKIRQESGEELHGLVHRDIKPANILLEPKTGRLLLTDFGIARARDAARSRRDAYTAGTINYLTPEQIRAQPVDERSDIYQVGLVLYEILAGGRKAFPGEEDSGVTGRIVDGTYEPLEKHSRKLDPGVIHIVKRAMERTQSKRYQSAEEMREAIRRYLREKYVEHDIQPTFKQFLQSGKVPSKRKFWNEARLRVAKIAAGVLLLAVIAVAAVWAVPKYILLPRKQAAYEKALDTYQSAYLDWSRQPWDPAHAEEVDTREAAFRVTEPTMSEYDRAIPLIESLTAQLNGELESVRQQWESSKTEFERLRRGVQINNPPDRLLGQLEAAIDDLDSLGNLELYIVADSAAQQHIPPFREFLDSKREQFDAGVTQTKDVINQKEQFCLNAGNNEEVRMVRNYEAQLSTKVTDCRARLAYTEGIEWMSTARDEVRQIRCPGQIVERTPPRDDWADTGPQRPACPGAEDRIHDARDALAVFKSEPEWEDHSKSTVFPMDVSTLENYLDEAATALRGENCSGVDDKTDAVFQGVARLYAEWTEDVVSQLGDCESENNVDAPRTPRYAEKLGEMTPYDQQNWTDFQNLLTVARQDLENCGTETVVDYYEAGLQAWEAGRCQEAQAYLSQVDSNHINYRYSRMLLGHARACQNHFDDATLRCYQEAGAVVQGNLLALSNILQCYYWLDQCDSVEAFFNHAMALGQWSCPGDAGYCRALIYHIKCDYDRFDESKNIEHKGRDIWMAYGRSGVQKCNRFEDCCPDHPELEEVREIRERFRTD